MSEKPARVSPLDRPWYPYLAAATSVVALAAQNTGRGVAGPNVALLLVLALSLSMVCWILAGLLVRDRARRGLLALIGVVVLVWFGSLRALAAALLPLPSTRAEALASVALLAALVLGVFWTVRTRRDLSGSVRFLNLALVGSLLVLALPWLTGAGGSAAEAGFGEQIEPQPDSGGEVVATAASDAPDIFLIILDSYTGPSSLLANYGLDVSDFTAALQRLGFVVPKAAKANYNATHLSLAAMLDWRYLDDLMDAAGGEGEDQLPTYELLHQNETLRFLRSRGYRYVFFRSRYPPLNGASSADLQIPAVLTGEFELMWLRGTLLDPIFRIGNSLSCKLMTCWTRNLPFQPDLAIRHERRFEALARVPESDRPTFVFAHVMLPHAPFVFGAQCEHVEPSWPELSDTPELRRSYALQVQCTNRKVLTLVEQLVSAGKRPTVILLQADHGYGRLPLGRPVPFERATPDQIEERFSIFAAYLLPGAPADLVYDSISPVNVLPRVFGHYLGLSHAPLPDRSYWSSFEEPFMFTRVH
jgi:hypothetical protein